MSYTRKNVWELGDVWSDEVLWYARAVKVMKGRALDDRSSWRFFGAIHGFDDQVWRQFGYLGQSDRMPKQADVDAFWEQCQHGSWYFLPWHRGYLLAFEAQVRDAIAHLNGPAATWALPYWNYSKPNQNGLPPAFSKADWPDGGTNPLFVAERYGPDDDGKVYIDLSQVDLSALGSDHDFVGTADGGSPGFGGPVTKFHHDKGPHGGLETQPHDHVHGLVGGGDETRFGLMSDPDTAALDPVFWLHHANIDRLWEVWKRTAGAKGDPRDAKWLAGPTGLGQRTFVMPMPGSKTLTYTPKQMSNLSGLDYAYDDLAPPPDPKGTAGRLVNLGLNTRMAAELAGRATAVPSPRSVELLGAHADGVAVIGNEANATVPLHPKVQRKLAASLAMQNASALPDRVFLDLENVTGLNDAAVLNVYLNVPPGQDPVQHPECKAGSVTLFGVRSASNPDRGHAGEGLSFVLEITSIVDRLHLAGELESGKLDVMIVPRRPVSEGARIRIGRISVYRQRG